MENKLNNLTQTNFEKIINQIINADKDAREITRLAEEKLIQVKNDINNRKKELKDKYLADAKNQIEHIKLQEKKMFEKSLLNAKENAAKNLKKLDRVESENIQQWEKQILNRILSV